MPLTGHLSELRRRLIISIAMLAVGMILSNFWLDEIMAFLSAPAGKLYFMKPAEAFFIYFKVMLTAGAIITAPVLFLRILGLFGSRLYDPRKAAALLPGTDVADPLPVGHRLLVVHRPPSGTSVFPQLFVRFRPAPALYGKLPEFCLHAGPALRPHLQPALVLIVLAKLGLITSSMLAQKRKYIILLSFIAAAVITPTTDILSQCLLAMPMIVLLEISRIIIKYGLRS